MRKLILTMLCFSMMACIPTQTDEIDPVAQQILTDQKQSVEPGTNPTNTPDMVLPVMATSPVEPTATLPVQPRATTPLAELPKTSTPAAEAGEIISEPLIQVDRWSLSLFNQIPPEYIEKASQIRWLNRVASVGANVSFGLDCLQNYFPDRDDPNRRPHACDRDLPSSEVVYSSQYDRSNWVFEFHSPPPNPNPGWNNKVAYFIDRVDGLSPDEYYDVVSFDIAYAEDPSINHHFFTNDNPNDAFPSVIDLASLRQRHPERTFIWWTLALARMSEPYTMEFNQRMREYAAENNLILIDIADIESHTPDGTPCTGIDREENPTDIPAICPDYTNERFAGHLNSLGHSRMAKAVWVLMAQLAGWEPPDSTP